jgi:hypothetical protein
MGRAVLYIPIQVNSYVPLLEVPAQPLYHEQVASSTYVHKFQ